MKAYNEPGVKVYNLSTYKVKRSKFWDYEVFSRSYYVYDGKTVVAMPQSYGRHTYYLPIGIFIISILPLFFRRMGLAKKCFLLLGGGLLSLHFLHAFMIGASDTFWIVGILVILLIIAILYYVLGSLADKEDETIARTVEDLIYLSILLICAEVAGMGGFMILIIFPSAVVNAITLLKMPKRAAT